MDTNAVAQLLEMMQKAQTGTPAGGMPNFVYMIAAALLIMAPGIASWLKSIANNIAIKEVHVAINSRLDEWMKTERSQGERDGRDAERKRGRTDEDARYEAGEVRREASEIRREAGQARQEAREELRRNREPERTSDTPHGMDENTAVIQQLLEEIKRYRGMTQPTHDAPESKPALRTTENP